MVPRVASMGGIDGIVCPASQFMAEDLGCLLRQYMPNVERPLLLDLICRATNSIRMRTQLEHSIN